MIRRSAFVSSVLVAGLCASCFLLAGSLPNMLAAQTAVPQGASPSPSGPHVPDASQNPRSQNAPASAAASATAPSGADQSQEQRNLSPLLHTLPSDLAVAEALSESQPDAADNSSGPAPSGALLNQLTQAREDLARAAAVQRRVLIAGSIVLVVLILAAVAVIIWLHLRARAWNRSSAESLEQTKAVAAQLKPLQEAREEIRRTLPGLLQEVGEQPLNFQEEGTCFPAHALTALDDIDHLAYLGDARLSFTALSQSDAAVYLNGLLLSSVAQLARSDPWMAMARLDRFLSLLGRYPGAVDAHRVAQAYSYRALAAYRVLEAQDAEPSWLRKSGRQQTEALAKQAFGDVAQASRLDPAWRHATFVEAQLCSRFYTPDETGESSRVELHIRGLRRAISLYKELIEEKRYRGAARHNLARCYKRIAEQTGEKSDFSDFGYALSSFPTDEELSDEALAARQPESRDRFLWQWMLGDPEMFRSVERLSLTEYRSFWIRLLDNKVHLRNWRSDLGELQRRDPAMREWSVQLLHVETPISLANPIARRQERFETPSSGA